MILRPVTPASPHGPPMTNRPVGLMWSLFDHHLVDVVAQARDVDVLVVLRRDDDRLDPRRTPIPVLDGHLALAVRAQVGERVLVADLGQPPREMVRDLDRHGHELGGLVAGETEHHPLIARAPGIHAAGDIGRLLIDGDDHPAGGIVESVIRVGIARRLDGVPDDASHVDVGVGGDLPDDQGQAGRHRRLAGHAPERVLGQDSVQNGVRDLVRDLVGMPLGDRLGAE
jgi:hypothetical protein